jgi:hypothetical protein
MRRTLKQHCDCEMRHRLSDLPPTELCLYHWTPSTNRNRISRYGLMPGSRSLQHGWRPPYVCLGDDPYLAWALSGDMWPDIHSWDLWMVNTCHQDSIPGWEVILDTYPDTGRHYIKEYRIYYRIFKRDLHYLATRTQ